MAQVTATYQCGRPPWVRILGTDYILEKGIEHSTKNLDNHSTAILQWILNHREHNGHHVKGILLEIGMKYYC